MDETITGIGYDFGHLQALRFCELYEQAENKRLVTTLWVDPLVADLGGGQRVPQQQALQGERVLRPPRLAEAVDHLDGDVLGHDVGEPSKKKGHGRKPVALSAALILVKNPPRRQTVPLG